MYRLPGEVVNTFCFRFLEFTKVPKLADAAEPKIIFRTPFLYIFSNVMIVLIVDPQKLLDMFSISLSKFVISSPKRLFNICLFINRMTKNSISISLVIFNYNSFHNNLGNSKFVQSQIVKNNKQLLSLCIEEGREAENRKKLLLHFTFVTSFACLSIICLKLFTDMDTVKQQKIGLMLVEYPMGFSCFLGGDFFYFS